MWRTAKQKPASEPKLRKSFFLFQAAARQFYLTFPSTVNHREWSAPMRLSVPATRTGLLLGRTEAWSPVS